MILSWSIPGITDVPSNCLAGGRHLPRKEQAAKGASDSRDGSRKPNDMSPNQTRETVDGLFLL